MGKTFIVKDANFSENGVEVISSELIYDSITNVTGTTSWEGTSVSAIGQPQADTSGRTVTKIAIKRYAGKTTSINIGVWKVNKTNNNAVLIGTIAKEDYNNTSISECKIDYVTFGADDILMVGATTIGNGSVICCQIADGNESTGFGRLNLNNDGTLSNIVYTTALMIKIWAVKI